MDNFNQTQPYIYGKELHFAEAFDGDLYNIYMVGLCGKPIMRDLSKESAEFIVDSVNSAVPDEFVACSHTRQIFDGGACVMPNLETPTVTDFTKTKLNFSEKWRINES